MDSFSSIFLVIEEIRGAMLQLSMTDLTSSDLKAGDDGFHGHQGSATQQRTYLASHLR